ncbi:hypothetical protein [Massilia suwonensis]|uniref:CcoQ/FixQ family Cbb3-type cytochrome c oxidase assembly chaperone n=1 Tax=Massilia suwonensis TaxID=648895 RepID=A0ABW0MN72_9BURK
MTGMVVLCAMLALLLVIWVLRRNARDRETFEKELEEELHEDDKRGD